MDLRSPSQKRRDLVTSQRTLASVEQQEDELWSFTEFDKVIEYTTRAALLYRFYEWNNFQDGMKAWAAMVMDPPDYTPPGSHSWWFVHFQQFHVQIQHSYHGATGVHRARLFYKQDATGKTLWLASCQVGPCYFFSQNLMAVAYMECLVKKEFFMTEKESRQIVAR